MITKVFPGVPLIPGIGNNDVLAHYSAPKTVDKSMYYNDLYTILFDNLGISNT